MTAYGQYIRWTGCDGSVTEVSVNGRETPEQARAAVIEQATLFGWTSPRWWQWWRRHDTRITP